MAGTFFQSGLGRAIRWLMLIVAGVLVLVVLLIDVFKVGSVALPTVDHVNVALLEQGWDPGWEVGQRQWFHHADQGTRLLKYDWFRALAQPELSVFRKPGKFSDPEYLQRFGFLPSHPDDRMNPEGLPLGFAINRKFQEPFEEAPEPYPVVGLTCAACHTGQINYQGRGIRIEGGSGMIDLGKFKTALGRALFYTKLFPWRFERFARSALGDQYSAETKSQLRAEVEQFIAVGRAAKARAQEKGQFSRESGFGRTDALGQILNRVFDDLNPDNVSVADAPVNFPHIWDSSWFEWVQYNASIRTPMTRNIGEVLGVGGLINLPGLGGKSWASTVNVPNLHRLEKQLSGEQPYGGLTTSKQSGLTSPTWPQEILGELDGKLVAAGATLYDKHCVRCHWKVDDIQAAYRTELGQGPPPIRAQMWTTKNQVGERFIKTSETIYNVEQIGTDPGAAVNFARRVVVLVNGRTLSAAGGNLDYLTNRVREVEYRKLGLVDEVGIAIEGQRERIWDYDANRLPFEEFQRAKITTGAPLDSQDERTYLMIEEQTNRQRDAVVRLGYKARPLNGIWATAPYLHNGSVRNLYQLLSPAAERDERFHLGTKQFDPANVGYVNARVTGGFEMDTRLPGNYNTGHEFRDRTDGEKKFPLTQGVLGPMLSHDERMAILEYLKSL